VRGARRHRVAAAGLALTSALGLGLFAWPLFGLGSPGAAAAEAVGVGVVVALAAVEALARRLDARSLALLAALASLDAGARATLVTGVGGFSPIFLLILCAGYVFGAEYGFLVGATSLLVSAVVTGGIGPWLPYQVFAAGWVGVAAGLLGARRRGAPGWVDVILLAALGVVCGYGYGMVMDVWDWTFFSAAPGLGFRPGMGLGVLAGHFARFYLVTSAVYDSFRAVGNAVLVALVGLPVLVALARLRGRLVVEILPFEAVAGEGPPRSPAGAPAPGGQASSSRGSIRSSRTASPSRDTE